MGLNMDCISSPYSYPFEQNQDAVRAFADNNCVWLGNYVNRNHIQFLRDFPSAHQIQQRQEAIHHKASHRRQQQISLLEIASDMDRRWNKKFMPREFV